MIRRVDMESFLHDVTVNIELYRVKSETVNICCNTYENLYSSVHSALQHIIPLCIDWERDGFISLSKSEMNVVLHKLQSLFQEHFTLELDNWSYSTRSFQHESHIRCGLSLVVIEQSNDQTQPAKNLGQVSAYCGPTGLGVSNKHLEMNKPTQLDPTFQHGDYDGTYLMPVLEPITPPSPKTPDEMQLISGDMLSNLSSDWALDCYNGDVINFDDIDKFFSNDSVTTPALPDMNDDKPHQQVDQFHTSSIHVIDEKPQVEEIHLKFIEPAADDVNDDDDDKWDLKLDDITKRFQATYDIKRGGAIHKKRKVKSFGMSRQEKQLIKSVLDEKPCEINKVERLKLLNRNLKMIKMFESLTRRIIAFVDQPIKLLCDEI